MRRCHTTATAVGQPSQTVGAVPVVRRGAVGRLLQHVVEGTRQVLSVAPDAVVDGLRDEHTIAVVAVGARLAAIHKDLAHEHIDRTLVGRLSRNVTG